MKEAPFVVLALDRERQWKFDGNAIIALHEALGEDALEKLSVLTPPKVEEGQEPTKKAMGPMFSVFRALLWAGLVTDDPTLTIEKSSTLWVPGQFVELFRQILPVFNESMSPKAAPES